MSVVNGTLNTHALRSVLDSVSVSISGLTVSFREKKHLSSYLNNQNSCLIRKSDKSSLRQSKGMAGFFFSVPSTSIVCK